MKSLDLKLPGLRIFLISEIENLKNLKENKKKWVITGRKDGFWYNLDNRTDFLLQRIPFQEYPEDQIGWTLRDKNELSVILKLIKSLNNLIEAIGIEKLDQDYFDSPLLDTVIEAAKQAYAVLMKDEDLEALVEAERNRVIPSNDNTD